MRNRQHSNRTPASLLVGALLAAIVAPAAGPLRAQIPPEAEVASVRLTRLWVGVSANGARASFDYQAGFFPNDYNIFGNRGQDAEAYGGMGFTLATTDWLTPDDTVQPVAVYGPTNVWQPAGLVVEPLKNYIRYGYPEQTVDYTPVTLVYPGESDPSKFAGYTFDQLIDVTTRHVFRVDIRRRIMAWSQTYNDNYVIVEVELTNNNPDTLWNFYFNMNEGNKNMQVSSVRNPFPAVGEWDLSGRALTSSWLHYYGGRVGDSMRVFYEYSADNPDLAGDNMGAPAVSQGGRLLYPHMTWYSILHASAAPYDEPAGDADDFTQPKVTYIGNSNLFPYTSGDDEFGSKNFWSVRGGFSDFFPMDTINSWPGTHHGGNNDDRGTADYSAYPSGSKSGTNNHKKYASFGPYTFAPGQKLRFVYASGIAGLSLKKSKEVGEAWLAGTLEEPSGLPDPVQGYFPANFAFPPDASESDRRKDRWISTGIDSVMKSAARARWNFEHGYGIPQSPPPPERITVTGHGDGVEIRWTGAAAEALPNFAGYRIMRRVGNQDTSFYGEIYFSGAGDLAAEHVFKDVTAKVGGQYYYHVQSMARIADDDPNADPSTRGQLLFSSRLLVPDVTKINPRFPPQDDLSKIRVAPNPYNLNDPLIPAYYGWTDNRGLLFLNLPPTVTIRIFTENGDMVKEWRHDEPVKTGLWFWNLITMNEQVANSGVYIAQFETPDGNTSFQKFVIVR